MPPIFSRIFFVVLYNAEVETNVGIFQLLTTDLFSNVFAVLCNADPFRERIVPPGTPQEVTLTCAGR